MRHGRTSNAAFVVVALLAAAAVLAFAARGCSLLGTGGSGGPGSVGTTTTPGVTTTVEPTAPVLPLAGKVLPPARGAYLGVYSPPAPFSPAGVEPFESKVHKRAAIVMWYQPWATDNRSRFDAGSVVAVMRQGKVPMITWEPWDPGSDANQVRDPANQRAYRLSAITSGRYDGYIRQWARDIRALGGPVMLRPMHEMNGNWYPWSGTVNGNTPARYVAAWRRMHDIFEEEGATNVTWVWSINHQSVPDTRANRYAAFYPGARYVDWVAISGFNWGTSSPVSSWHTFDYWYRAPLAYLNTLKKPIVIAEFASVENGGNKAAWITDAYKRIRAAPRVRAVVYYDAIERGSSTQDWRVDTSAASLSAFRKAVSLSHFVGSAPAALSEWQDSLDDGALRYLTTLKPLY